MRLALIQVCLFFANVYIVSGFVVQEQRAHLQGSTSTSKDYSTFKYKYREQSQLNAVPSHFNNEEVEYTLIQDINLISSHEWDNCLPKSTRYEGQTSAPFLRHAFLSALEASHCVSPERGWLPRHLQIKVSGQLAAYIPMYIKSHSMGEFIFDNEWADYAQQKGIAYYPKILIGSPFSPVTSEKILMDSDFRDRLQQMTLLDSKKEETMDATREFRKLVANIIISIVKSSKLSSAHINFLTDDEARDIAGELMFSQSMQVEANNVGTAHDASTEDGTLKSRNKPKAVFKSVINQIAKYTRQVYIRKTTLQYHWVNKNAETNEKYTSFNDYLSRFKSKKRIKIKRERNKVSVDQNIRVDAIVGKQILEYPGLVEKMYEIYKSTVDKMFWGNLYFTLEFFEMLVESDFVNNLVFMCARFKKEYSFSVKDDNDNFEANDVIAGTINIVEDGVFYGRYWGALPEYDDIKNLHFEVCYWSAIQYCIENELEKMEPGAGGGSYKWIRGYDPVLIHSCHYIARSSLRKCIREYVQHENGRQFAIAQLLIEKSAVKGKAKNSISPT